MKKKLTLAGRRNSHAYKQFLLAMRLTVFLIVFSVAAVIANTGHSQEAKITLQLKNATLSDVLNTIESNSSYYFMLNNKLIDLSKRIDIDVHDKMINDILTLLSEKTGIKYKIYDRQIVLSPGDQRLNEVSVMQQQKSMTGKVTDSAGEPLPGVSVVVKGTTTGTITGSDGKYVLANIPANATLAFSFVGMKSQEMSTLGKSSLDVIMLEESVGIDEVVAVGYGVQKKSNLTGSVASIKTNDYKDLNVGITSVIQGRVAGVNVSNGNIIIRGAASVNGSDPLWIVDGVPGSAPNLNDIESIEILKDAASTAIYGARGAGGVILVTTKKGKAGKLVINARANVGISSPIDIADMLSTPDFINRKLAAGFTQSDASGWNDPSSLPNTNWNDLIWRKPLLQSYFLQMSGGSDKTTFDISGEYIKNQSIEIKAFDEKGNFRFASQTKFNKKIDVTSIVNLVYSNSAPHIFGGGGASSIWYRQVPTMSPYDITNVSGGGWGMAPAGGYYEGGNPLANLLTNHANNKSYSGNANLILNWEVLNGLKYQTTLSMNLNSYANNTFSESYSVGAVSQLSKFTKDYGLKQSLRMQHTITYEHNWNDRHNIKALVGYEASSGLITTAGGWKYDFSIQPAYDMSLGTGSTDATGTKSESRSVSQFARINYDYDGKYLFEASIRRDGYDNFGPSNRFGVFPSLSGGWNIAKETFIKDNVNWLSQLKLRGSYGRIGNNTVPQFLYESSYTNTYLYYSYDDITTKRGFWLKSVANKDIKWEDVSQWNIGIDASILNNHLNTSIEYYNKKTSDMLYSVSTPPSSGTYSEPFSISSSYMANIGQISNKGLEWMIQWKGAHKDFTYDVALTLSKNVNKVIKLSDAVNPIIYKGTSTALNSSIYRTENGQPMGQMYGYIVDGIFRDQAEIDKLNASSPSGFYQQVGTSPGDLKYRDVNNDGKITEADKTFIGNPWPKLIYGLNLSMSWKGFDLIMGILGNYKMDVFNSAKIYERSFYGDFNTTYKVYEAWSETNKNASNPRVIKTDPNGNFKNVSSYFVENGSFFKIKNLHFGYNLPKQVVSRINLDGLKVFVNLDNMFIISKFQGDPEIAGGYLQRNNYSEKRSPSTRSVMLGLSLTL